MDWVFRI